MKNRVKKFENGIEVIERFDYLKTSQVLYSFLDQLQNVPCHCIPSQITREGGVTEVTSFFFSNRRLREFNFKLFVPRFLGNRRGCPLLIIYLKKSFLQPKRAGK
jgi:hypothetical protein